MLLLDSKALSHRLSGTRRMPKVIRYRRPQLLTADRQRNLFGLWNTCATEERRALGSRCRSGDLARLWHSSYYWQRNCQGKEINAVPSSPWPIHMNGCHWMRICTALPYVRPGTIYATPRLPSMTIACQPRARIMARSLDPFQLAPKF